MDTSIDHMEASQSSLNSIDRESSATSSANVETQPSAKWTSTTTPASASPLHSRETSPLRSVAKTGRTSRNSSTTRTRSRQNSLQDPSPSRRSGIPAPSGIPRQQLSTASTPVLPPPPTSEPVIRAPVPQKPLVTADPLKDTPRWPVSPRLKSPPPSLNRPAVANSSRKVDQEPPIINVQRSTPSPLPDSASQTVSDSEVEDSASLQPGMRTPVRGGSSAASTLETVQEVSQPNTPAPGIDAALEKLAAEASDGGSQNASTEALVGKKIKAGSQNSESGSESGSVKSNARRSSSTAPPPLLQTRQSSTALKYSGKGQGQAEGSGHMTVETELVNAIPQVSLVSNASQKTNGSLRTKASSETIRPKKEKKKHHNRKPASVAPGNASSKADIFEAKIASAVEEANSSDSDETFVYDSNPPDASDRPRRQHHSRTPSATSMASQVDRNGMRSIHSVMENGNGAAPPKKNMKFVNTYNSNGTDSNFGDEDGKGTGRSHAGSARGTARHHHHPGRWGRGNGNNHLSLFDNESPFPNASRSKLGGNNSRPPSNPPSPRFASGRAGTANGRRQFATSSYDLDDTTTGADDETTPLIREGTMRSSRSARSRRFRSLEDQTYRPAPSFLNRFAGCLVLTILLLLVSTGAICFMFATSQPLTDVELVKIGHVLASPQELMLDITVKAHNPNVVVVMVDAADLEIFAKSPHAGLDSDWLPRPGDPSLPPIGPHDDAPADSDNMSLKSLAEDPVDDASPNLQLGSIISLDSPLIYEGSLFRAGVSTASGELRLGHPGNMTLHGPERWERVLSHEFTLIIKGVLKYTLPLSQRVRSVSISGKTIVKPNSANDPSLKPKPNSTLESEDGSS